MNAFFSDLRFALRGLLRSPGFTAVAVLTVALGIGATTAVFTLVDGVLLSPLPFPNADRLVSIAHLGREGRDQLPLSDGLYLLYGDRVESLDAVALYTGTAVNVVVDGRPARVQAQAVTPSFFQVLGTQAELGRTFLESEGAPDGEQVVVLSDGYWRSELGADPSVVGGTLDVNGVQRTVVGVMPPGFGFPNREARMWAPYVVYPDQAPLASFSAAGIGRLAEGASLDRLTAEVEGLIGRLAELYPESREPAFLSQVQLRSRLRPLKEALVGDVRTTLWILLGTVAFVLLIAAANVANLLLVRAESRQREMAVRSALGAGRLQVVRWFLSESALLAVAGGVLGTALAAVAVGVSIRAVPTSIPRLDELGVDVRVLAFAALITVAAALFSGLFPVLRTRRGSLSDRLREGSGRGTAGRERHRLRNGLVVTQIALALVLLIGSGLMFRSFRALRSIDPGYDAADYLTADVIVPTAEIEDPVAVDAFYRQLADRLAGLPGVVAVGYGNGLPLTGGPAFYSMGVEDHPRGDDELPILASHIRVGPGYFDALGIPLLEGRLPRADDDATGARSVVVSESFARHWWPESSPIGRRVRTGYDGEEWFTIVGVVGDAHYQGLQAPAEEMVYWPLLVGPTDAPAVSRFQAMVLRTDGDTDPLALLPALRQAVAEVNPRIPVSDPGTGRRIRDDASARTSFTMALLGSASVIALLLGLVGIYGVISYVVGQRTREIGIRMAMGATQSSVQGLVVRHGLALAGIGVGVGLVAAAGLSRTMSSVLYGVPPVDPVTYGALAVLLVAVATAASWVPAFRASRVDPSDALRVE